MPHALEDLPVELLLDDVFPLIALPDFGNLAATNSRFAALTSDDTFWKHKCERDFNFTSFETARTSGWKLLYKGLFRPRIFVWGYAIRSCCPQSN
jgi:SCF-associated factor 1